MEKKTSTRIDFIVTQPYSESLPSLQRWFYSRNTIILDAFCTWNVYINLDYRLLYFQVSKNLIAIINKNKKQGNIIKLHLHIY